MTRFHLIRHGDKLTPPDLLSGRAPGVHLSQTGETQARAVAEMLAEAGISRIFTSPRERARETAAPLAQRLGLEPEIAAALDEMDLGLWTGLHPSVLQRSPAFERFNRVRALARIPGGETMLEVQARFVSAMLQWSEQFPDEALALFSHAEPIRAALLYFSGSSLNDWARWPVDLGSVTTIDIDRDHARLVAVNQTPPFETLPRANDALPWPFPEEVIS